MWIILLDHSSSMASEFKNAPKAGRLVKASEAETRLDAAKETLLELLTRWAPEDEVLLLPFTSPVERIGPLKAGERARFEQALSTLQPDDGTDIAAALNAAADEVEKRSERATAFLISDGESDHDKALEAAGRCGKLGVTVFVYAIDPDEEAEALALRIASATGGSWDPVTSKRALRQATSETAARVEAQAKAAAAMVERFEREHQELARQRQTNDEVLFTAAHPRRITPKRAYPLHLAVHREDELEAVQRSLKGKLGRWNLAAQLTTRETGKRLPHGTVLEVEPRLPGILVSPRRAEVVWLGTAAVVDFEIRTLEDQASEGVVEGRIEITTQQGLPIAQTPVAILIAASSKDTKDLPEVATGRLIDRVFASYAHEDEPVVLACRAVYQGLGIQLFVDHEDIASGAAWHEALAKAIGGSDLFQLYWSEAAAASQEVRKEWELALGLEAQKHRPFVRPLHWQARDPVPDPPPELKAAHFRYIDLSVLKLENKAARTKPLGGGATELEIERQLAILPLVGDGGAIEDLIRREMGRVVALLEAVTGLRYSPAPILLVDHYTVRSVREVLTVDKADESGGGAIPPKEAEWMLALLTSLLLGFHVRRLQGEYLDDAKLAEFYGLDDILALGDFLHLRRVSEGSISHLIEKRLQGEDPCSAGDDGSAAIAKASADRDRGRFALESYIAHLAAVCTDDDREKLEQAVGPWLSSNGARQGADIKKRDIATVLERLTTIAAVELRQRYAGGFYSLFGPERTSLCRLSDLTSYLHRCMELIEGYSQTALSRRGDTTIEIGYALPLEVLGHAQAELGLDLRVEKEIKDWGGRGRGEYTYSLVLSEYRRAISLLHERLMPAVAAAPMPARRLRCLVEVMLPTYGICVLPGAGDVEDKIAAAAVKAGWPEAAALPGMTKVLVCRQAVDELHAELEAVGEPTEEIDARIAALLHSVLVHEHFHAALAYGLDRLGRAAGAVKSARLWGRGRNLNEALAAWVELHLSREDPWLSARIREWITAGAYPIWPYRGALQLERLYEAQGLLAIQELITSFRANPQGAQDRFERTVAATPA